MNNAPAAPPPNTSRAMKPIDEVRATLARLEPELKKALPDNIRPEHFARVMITALQQKPELLDCDKASLYAAGLRCAADGLVPDGREAALVPFKGKVQYLPMVGGILKKIRNSGELGSITAHVVHEKDVFEWVMGDDEKIVHKAPALGQERGAPIGVYAIAVMKDGFKYREVLSKAEVEKVRAVSRNAGKDDSPWVTWPEEQWKKTALKRMSKRMPMSTDLMATIEREDEDPETPAAPATTTTSTAPASPAAAARPASRMHEAIDAEVVKDTAPPAAAPAPAARPAAPAPAAPPQAQPADEEGDAQEPTDESQVPI